MTKLFRTFVADMKALLRKTGAFLTRNSKIIGQAALVLGVISFIGSLFISTPNAKDNLLLIGLASILAGVIFIYKAMKGQGRY